MIKSLSDAKRLVADIHNSILKSLEQKDTEIRRQAIDLLRDLFEEKDYRITYEGSDEIEFEATQTFPDDWSSTGKRHHRVDRKMLFWWMYCEEDSRNLTKGWNIMARISLHEMYDTHEGYYSERQTFVINWSVSQKKWLQIHRDCNESKFTPKR